MLPFYDAQENREFHEDDIENSYYLLCIFDAIMNTMTKANGKKVSNIMVCWWDIVDMI